MPVNTISLCDRCGNTFAFTLESIPSNFFELLRGNYVPTPPEAANYKQSVKDAERVLSDIDGMIENLRSKRKDVLEYIEQSSALLSPIRRLPNELLGSTFAHLSKSLTFSEGNFCGSDVWRIREVCTRWKDIVTSTASFWSRLTFKEHLDNQDTVSYNKQFIDLLLCYSRNASLHIAFDCADYERQDPDGFLGDIVERNADRIQSLSLNPWSLAALANIDNFPVLTTLEIDDTQGGMEEGEADLQSKTTCFLNAPNLRSIGYNHVPFGAYLELRWEFIDKISINTFLSEQLAFVQANCPNLSDLEWSPDKLREDSATLYFPNLEKLTLHLFSAACRDSGVDTLERFELPVLRELELIADVNDDDKQFLKSFRSLLSNHSSTLQCLCLTNVASLPGSQLLSTLAALPRLRRFTYKLLPDHERPAFSSLLAPQSDTLVPELEDLHIEGGELIIDSLVIKGLVSRRRHQSGQDKGPLKRLSLTFMKVEFRGNALSELERLRCDGLIVCINGVYSNWQ